MNEFMTRSVAICTALSICGCAGPGITPRENFNEWLGSYVGQNIREQEKVAHQLASKEIKVGSNALPNGNVENLYKLPFKHKRLPEHCIYAMEYDPKTFAIAKTRIERGIDACYIVP